MQNINFLFNLCDSLGVDFLEFKIKFEALGDLQQERLSRFAESIKDITLGADGFDGNFREMVLSEVRSLKLCLLNQIGYLYDLYLSDIDTNHHKRVHAPKDPLEQKEGESDKDYIKRLEALVNKVDSIRKEKDSEYYTKLYAKYDHPKDGDQTSKEKGVSNNG